jgi:ParB/RepB/Spo0J family partition protein
MAITINAGDVKRNDSGIGIDPENIIIDETSNGRKYPHTEKEIEDLAENIRAEGQKQAVQVRRVEDNRVKMVLGIGRWKAVNYLNQKYPDEPKRKLQCVVIAKMDEEGALVANIVENEFRVATTIIDKAYCQHKLRTEHGWTDTRIAGLYRCEPSYVGKIKRLLDLPEDKQLRVAKGSLSVDAALAWLDLDAEDRAEIAPALPVAVTATAPDDPALPPTATTVDGVTIPLAVNEPTSAEIIERAREKKIDKGGKQPRNRAAVRKFLKKNADAGNPLKPFADTFLKFIDGYYKDDTMEAKLRELLKAPEVAAEAA